MEEAITFLKYYGIDAAAVIFVTVRLLWFIRKQKSWEVFIFLFLLTAGGAANLASKNAWFHLNQKSLIAAGIISLLIALEPELYRLFRFFLRQTKIKKIGKDRLDALCAATEILAHTKVGALIAFEQNDDLGKLSKSGTAVNADISKELLTALFSKDTLTHDGGVIIRDGRVAHCGVIFPLSHSLDIDKTLGTRHRAAIGLTENYDAICIVVSEEEGTMSLAKDGKIFYNLDRKSFRKKLQRWLQKKPAKKIYPIHRLRTYRLLYALPMKIEFQKSFSLFFYDLLGLIFWIVFTGNMMFAESQLINQGIIRQFFQSGVSFHEPWKLIPMFMICWQFLMAITRFELRLDKNQNALVKENGILFLRLYRRKYALDNFKRIIIKRETPKIPLWSLILENRSRKKMLVDSAGNSHDLFSVGKKILELLQIEFVNQS